MAPRSILRHKAVSFTYSFFQRRHLFVLRQRSRHFITLYFIIVIFTVSTLQLPFRLREHNRPVKIAAFFGGFSIKIFTSETSTTCPKTAESSIFRFCSRFRFFWPFVVLCENVFPDRGGHESERLCNDVIISYRSQDNYAMRSSDNRTANYQFRTINATDFRVL